MPAPAAPGPRGRERLAADAITNSTYWPLVRPVAAAASGLKRLVKTKKCHWAACPAAPPRRGDWAPTLEAGTGMPLVATTDTGGLWTGPKAEAEPSDSAVATMSSPLAASEARATTKSWTMAGRFRRFWASREARALTFTRRATTWTMYSFDSGGSSTTRSTLLTVSKTELVTPSSTTSTALVPGRGAVYPVRARSLPTKISPVRTFETIRSRSLTSLTPAAGLPGGSVQTSVKWKAPPEATSLVVRRRRTDWLVPVESSPANPANSTTEPSARFNRTPLSSARGRLGLPQPP